MTPRYPHLLHGADYNPEQWKSYPGIFEKDMMKKERPLMLNKFYEMPENKKKGNERVIPPFGTVALKE